MGDLCGAIESAAKSYSKFLKATEAMVGTFPDGTKMPSGCAAMLGDASNIVAGEMHRHSGGSRHPLPGSRAPSISTMGKPEAVDPAESVIRGYNEHLITAVRGQMQIIAEAERQVAAEAA